MDSGTGRRVLINNSMQGSSSSLETEGCQFYSPGWRELCSEVSVQGLQMRNRHDGCLLREEERSDRASHQRSCSISQLSL